MAVDITKWNLLGKRVLFDGQDLGIIKDLTPTENVTEYPFVGDYDGQNFEYDSAITGGDLGFNFTSSMILDEAVQTLWAGGTPGSIKRGFSEEGPLVIQGISSIPGKGGLTLTFPKTKLRRNGFPAFNGDAESTFPFTAKIFFDSATGRYGTYGGNNIQGGV